MQVDRLTDDALDAHLASPSFMADPYPALRHLRERDPVHWSPSLGAWLVTRYDDLMQTYLDVEHFSNEGRMTRALDHLSDEERCTLPDFRAFYLAKGLVHADPPARPSTSRRRS